MAASQKEKNVVSPQPQPPHVVDSSPIQSNYSKRILLKTILCSKDGGVEFVGERVVVGGWIKSSKVQMKDPPPRPTPTKDVTVTGVEILQSRIPLFRSIFKVLGCASGTNNNRPIPEKLEPVPELAYLKLSDGSCVPSLQVLLEASISPLFLYTVKGLFLYTLTGTSILVEGVLKKSSVPGNHAIELKVEKILHVGTVDHASYPLAKTGIPLDNLRICSHLRPRMTTVASITRIRSALSQATQRLFQNNGFLHVQMPVITSVDAKGFTDKFYVTSLSRIQDGRDVPNATDDSGTVNLDVIKASIKEKNNNIQELKRSESNKEALVLALQDLQKANELASQLEAQQKSNQAVLSSKDGKDYSKDFFSHQMYLTASAQLHLESYACALGNVYSFGPTFQADKSQSTKHHLAESWMVELEMAFADLEDLMNCAEDYLKLLCQWVLENCSDDMEFVSKRIDKTIIDRLQSVASSTFEKIAYTEAVEVLNKVTEKKFEANIEWGGVLTDEHESYLTEELYKKPVIIYNHPKELKTFSARLNDDGNTVRTIDVIVPKVGTLIRGSQKEERIDKLETRIEELGLPREQYEWYLDLRRHGTVKHSGFSLGFDQMVLFATGLIDVRDAIAFPRCNNTNY